MALYSHTIDSVIAKHGDQELHITVRGDVTNLLDNVAVTLPPQDIFNLMARHFKFLTDVFGPTREIPLEGFPIDGDWTNVHASNVCYRFTSPIPHDFLEGFFVIPNHPFRSINSKGEIVGTCNGKSYIWSPDTRGYLNNQLKYFEHNITISKHRAMMLTFRPIPTNIGYLEVNHIDGDKDNCELSNLEWVTPKENIEHAMRTGLMSKPVNSRKILVRNARNGSVYEFGSQKACSEKFGILEKTLEYRLNHQVFCQIWADGLQFKYGHDERDWVYWEDVEGEIAKQQAKHRKGCRIRNCRTGEITVLDNVNAAGKVMGCGVRTPHNLLKQERYGPFEGFQIVPNDGTEFPDFTERQFINSFSSYSGFNVEKRVIIVARSLKHMSDLTGLDPRGIDTNAQFGKEAYHGYLFKRGAGYSVSDFITLK